MFVFLMLITTLTACQYAQKNKVEQEEWIPLFNGKDLTGWDAKFAGYPLNHNYLDTFVFEDGMLRIKYDEYEHFNDAFGHLYYKTPFSYYKLKFDYRFTGEQMIGGKASNIRNSGIMLHAQSARSNELAQTFPISVELQLLGGLSDGKERATGNACTPGTAVEIASKVEHQHCIQSSSQTYHGDQWVHGEAIVMGGESMVFKIEGETVLAFQKPQLNTAYVRKNGKGQNWAKSGISRDIPMWLARSGEVLTEGYIAIQAESHAIDFKNIELLNLMGCTDKSAKNYKSYFVKANNQTCQY
ncbi:3-keto-disaccharide hydrolase [Thalassotalea sp. PLHSN55]|uniref:3-keto-disaccharide hydrolase n=1 Tax=Thalassotalea sp. PLHSN55 TaxID=3435888 RepID=UPI003F87ADA9